MRNFGFSNAASILTAVLVIFENSFVTQFRLILLDGILLFFISLTVLFWSSFCKYSNRAFSIKWWTELIKVGVCLGLTVSVKWVGLFLIATIGILTVFQLANLLINAKVPLNVFGKHFISRFYCLVLIPIVIYLVSCQIHFTVITKTGRGVTAMPPEYEATLIGTNLTDTLKYVASGSVVTLRTMASPRGYLTFESDKPSNQKIICSPFRDATNAFKITQLSDHLGVSTQLKF